MPWMAFGWIASPIHDEVGAILDFAKRASDLTTQLGGDFGWPVSERGMTVNHPTNQLGQKHGFSLGLTGDIAQSVDEGHVGLIKVLCCDFNGFLNRRFSAIDERLGKFFLSRVIFEPGSAQAARRLGVYDVFSLGVQFNIVTHAAAKRAGRVLYDVQTHGHSRVMEFLLRPDRTAEE